MNMPLYKSIYEDIKQKIKDSTYPVDTQLPTDKEFTEIYNVSTITIKKAMDLLEVDGLISRKPRIGTFVISDNVESQQYKQFNSKVPVIGLVIPSFNDYFGTQTLHSLFNASVGKSQIILKLSHGDYKLEDKLINELIDLKVDGILLLPSSSEYISPTLLRLISKQFPIVLIDRFIDKLPTCNVQIDNQSASTTLIEHVFENGHKYIGIISGNRDVTTNNERVTGAITAHLNHHFAISNAQILSSVRPVRFSIENQEINNKNVEMIIKFLESNSNVTAIFATEYAIALLIKQAIAEIGKSIPEDYSVVCFDHAQFELLDKESIHFTHIQQDENILGQESLKLILEKINNPQLVKKITVPSNLISGNSVRNLSDK